MDAQEHVPCNRVLESAEYHTGLFLPLSLWHALRLAVASLCSSAKFASLSKVKEEEEEENPAHLITTATVTALFRAYLFGSWIKNNMILLPDWVYRSVRLRKRHSFLSLSFHQSACTLSHFDTSTIGCHSTQQPRQWEDYTLKEVPKGCTQLVLWHIHCYPSLFIEISFCFLFFLLPLKVVAAQPWHSENELHDWQEKDK